MNEDPNEELTRLLRTWDVSPAPTPGFTTAVWRRIAMEDASDGITLRSRLRSWLTVQLPRPVYATTLLAATIVLTGVVATLQASYIRDHNRLENARHYLASIDPLSRAMNGAQAHQ